jgi:uncharacterized protein (DUF1800 family)
MLRDNALGNFQDILVNIAKDAAMLVWLDGRSNTKTIPQENFGRELMELFSRGVGFYTENDVYAAARVFTGWNLKTTGGAQDPTSAFAFVYNAGQHETSAKAFSFPIYSSGGSTIPARSASGGMQDGIDLITALASHPETARRIAGKLYAFFISETVTPDPAFIDEIAGVYLQNGTVMKPVVQHILTSPQFQDPSVFFTRYSWPVEFVVRSLKEAGWSGFSVGTALSPLLNMGQQLLEPPNVAGWVLGQSWFSTGAMLSRMNFASTLASNQKFNLASVAAFGRDSAQSLVNTLLTRFTPADLDSRVYADLVSYASAGGAWTGSTAQLQAKAPGLAHLILGSADYQFV